MWPIVVSDALIAATYFFIPAVVFSLLRHRSSLLFHRIHVACSVFLLGCGATHALDVFNVWHANYSLAEALKLFTALSSLLAAWTVWRSFRLAVSTPSSDEIVSLNEELRAEVDRCSVGLQELEREKAALTKVVDQQVHELKGTEEHYRTIVENVPDYAICTLTIEGVIVSWNEGARAICGYLPHEMIGRQFSDLLAEKSRYSVSMASLLDQAKELGRIRFEGLLSRKDSESFWASTTIIASRDSNGTVAGFSTISIDLSIARCRESERQRYQADLKSLAERLERIREEERTRIARELHDELGQALTGLKLKLAAAKSAVAEIGAYPVEQNIDQMIDEVDRTIHSAREISTRLRPAVLDNLGLVAALEWHVREFSKSTKMECKFSSEIVESSLGAHLVTVLFRSAQELLTNVARHSEAHTASVSLVQRSHLLELSVVDDGKGYSPQSARVGRLGLIGLRERASAVGGTFKIEKLPAGGTRATMILPNVAETIREV